MTQPWSNLVKVGDRVTFAKTVSESDVYAFAGITGDLHPNHVNAEYMAKGRFGQRVAHGALVVGLMSGASTAFALAIADPPDSVALGYDRIRFLAPVFFGDTLSVEYEISSVDLERSRATAAIRVTNQRGELVAVADHITKYVR